MKFVLIGLVVILAAAAGCGQIIAQRTETDNPPGGAFAETDMGAVHYVAEGEGQVIVFVHGASGNLKDWTASPVFQAAAKRGRAIAVDRPGFGYTDRPEGGEDPRVQARMLAAALDRIAPEERAVIVGHSYGGAVAMGWLLERPEQVAGVLSLAGAVYPWPGDAVATYYKVANTPVIGPLAVRTAIPTLGSAMIDEAVAGVFEPQQPPENYVERSGAALALRPETFRANAADISALKDYLRVMGPLYYQHDGVPIEAVHGDADDTVGAVVHSEPLARNLESAQFTLLPGIGHMPHHVAADDVIAALDRLLARVSRTE